MPELPEIKRFAFIINSNGRGKTFVLNQGNLVIPQPWAKGFSMHAIARGKELRVTLSLETNPASKVWVLFTHGLVGRWMWQPSVAPLPKGTQLVFQATDGSGNLLFVDIQRMGKYNVLTSESWGKGRGADPVDEYELFKKNLIDNRAKKDFEQPIGELLLDQKYFNGVGNYLRAEILCRAGISPLTKAFAVFQNEAQREKLMQLARLIPMEVLERGLNKYGTPKEVSEFEAWMRCYSKSKGVKDKGGRMLWFFEDQAKHEEPLPTVNEAAYRRMFPLGDEVPVSSHTTGSSAAATAAPGSPSFSFAAAPAPAPAPSSPVISFSAPISIPLSTFSLSTPATTTATAPTTGGAIESYLTATKWRQMLEPEFRKPYWNSLKTFLEGELKRNVPIHPPLPLVFNALNLCDFDAVRVVILGQDPYHDKGQAHGLCFSVGPGIPPPPSLKNIYTELAADVNMKPPKHGNLTAWAKRGVLLLNACLTVEEHKANSHAGKGWEEFTDAVIRLVSEQRSNVVFILWGSFAQKKGKNINRTKHCVLEGAHPSPLSVTKFRGCKHFSQANTYLLGHGLPPINWTLPASADDVDSAGPTQPLPTINVAPAATAPKAGLWKCACCENLNAQSSTECESCMTRNPATPLPVSPFNKSPTPKAFGTVANATTSAATCPVAPSLLPYVPVLTQLLEHPHSWPFTVPVDPVALGLADYFAIIKQPMDLGTIKKKLPSYQTPEEFIKDVNLVFSNALVYNPPASDISTMARNLKSQFETELARIRSAGSGFNTSAVASNAAPTTTTTTATTTTTTSTSTTNTALGELVPVPEAVSRMGRMLLLLSTLQKNGMLTVEQKNQLKDLAIARDRLVFAALESFAADEDRDLAEVADTFRRICKYRPL